MPDLALIERGEQPMADTGVIENEDAVGKPDCTGQIDQAFGISTQDDWCWDVMPAAGDALAHAGQRSECVGEAHIDQGDFVSGRLCVGHHAQFAVAGQRGFHGKVLRRLDQRAAL